MNYRKLFLPIIIVLSACFMLSCSSDDDSNDDSVTNQVQTNVKNGTWRVTKFIDSGKDETADFAGYSFVFKSDGEVLATKGSISYTGRWSVTKDSSDDNPSHMHFNLLFDPTSDFEDLNDDWDITSQSAIKIELIDVSGGNGGTDYLTFEKN